MHAKSRNVQHAPTRKQRLYHFMHIYIFMYNDIDGGKAKICRVVFV